MPNSLPCKGRWMGNEVLGGGVMHWMAVMGGAVTVAVRLVPAAILSVVTWVILPQHLPRIKWLHNTIQTKNELNEWKFHRRHCKQDCTNKSTSTIKRQYQLEKQYWFPLPVRIQDISPDEHYSVSSPLSSRRPQPACFLYFVRYDDHLITPQKKRKINRFILFQSYRPCSYCDFRESRTNFRWVRDVVSVDVSGARRCPVTSAIRSHPSAISLN